jgi:putative membrane protein
VAVVILTPHLMVEHNSWVTYLVLGLVFGLVNALIRPLLMFMTCPFIILTLGLGTLLVNTALFYLTGWIGSLVGMGLTIENFWWALLGSVIVSIVSVVLGGLFKDDRHENRKH